ASVEQVLADYKKRWEIETLFKALKSSGFKFEDTHMTDHKKIERLIAFLSLAFLFAYTTGEWKNERKPIKLKSHGRKEASTFKYELDHIHEILMNIPEKMSELQELLPVLAQCFSAKSLL
ncbi:hypothetical protein TI05_09305, partial [Achromatium sp. WMS3]